MQEDDMEELNKSDEEQLDEGGPSPTFNVSESCKASTNNYVQKGEDDNHSHNNNKLTALSSLQSKLHVNLNFMSA